MGRIKNKHMGPNQADKLLHSKANHKRKEKTAYGLEENIYTTKKGLVSEI